MGDDQLQNCGIRRGLQDLLHVRDRHQESVQGQLHVVVQLEGLRGLRRAYAETETETEVARHLTHVQLHCRSYLHGLQHEMLEDNVDELQGYLQEDRWLQNCRIRRKFQDLLHVEVCHQSYLPRQLHVVVCLEGLRCLWFPGREIARHQSEVRLRCRPDLHGLQHQVLQEYPGELQENMRQDDRLQNCGIRRGL